MKKLTLGTQAPKAGTRNTVGGAPLLPSGSQVPHCAQCQTRMTLFFQLDLPAEAGPHAGAHLLAFMCPNHNDVGKFCEDGQRPESFWEDETGAFSLLLFTSVQELVAHDEDPYLVSHELLMNDSDEEVTTYDGIESGEDVFKVGGVPFRANNEVRAECGCGCPMSFVCEVPDGYGFLRKPDAPEQADSFSVNDYCLFLGNIVCILACDAHCNRGTVTAILDN